MWFVRQASGPKYAAQTAKCSEIWALCEAERGETALVFARRRRGMSFVMLEVMHTVPPSAPVPASGPPTEFSAAALMALFPDLRRRARMLERDVSAADDLVQDTLERALRFRHAYQAGSNLRAWLLCIQQNIFISRKRRLSMSRRVHETLRVDPNGWNHESITDEPAHLSPAVERAVQALPPRLGQVLVLVDLGEYSYRDAADELAVPVGTIMSRLHRARTRLKEKLTDRESMHAA